MKTFIKFLFIVAIASVIVEGYLCIYPIKKGNQDALNKSEVMQVDSLHSEIPTTMVCDSTLVQCKLIKDTLK